MRQSLGFSFQSAFGIEINATEPLPLNVGGAGGQRIVSTAFTTFIGDKRRGTPEGTVLLTADLPREEFQDAFAIRRRCARAVVGVGKRLAAKIEGGQVPSEFSRQVGWNTTITVPWFTLSFDGHETYEGYDRRGHGSVSIFADPADDPELRREWVLLVAHGFKILAEGLHSAVDNDANVAFFGLR